jgi:hypothetical protein
MSTHPKIMQLLDITGTPPDRRDLAIRNYTRLLNAQGETALDSRISQFRQMQTDVDVWWQEREKRSASQQWLADYVVRKKALVRRIQALLETLERIDGLVAVPNQGRAAPAIAWRSIVRESTVGHRRAFFGLRRYMLGLRTYMHSLLSQFGHESGFIGGASDKSERGLLQTIDLEVDAIGKFLSNIREELLGASDWSKRQALANKLEANSVDTDRAISGFGDLALHVRQTAPDCIVALNVGGNILGEFVTEHLKLGVPVIHLFIDREGLVVNRQSSTIPQQVRRPLVIDGIARTGRTIQNAFRWIDASFPGASHHAAALAASMGAIDTIGSSCLHTPNPMLQATIKLPYDSEAGFAVIGESAARAYVFGANAHSTRDRLVVPIETINKLEAERA